MDAKGLRDGLKVVKRTVVKNGALIGQGVKTIRKSVRQAGKLLNSAGGGTTKPPPNSGNPAAAGMNGPGGVPVENETNQENMNSVTSTGPVEEVAHSSTITEGNGDETCPSPTASHSSVESDTANNENKELSFTIQDQVADALNDERLKDNSRKTAPRLDDQKGVGEPNGNAPTLQFFRDWVQNLETSLCVPTFDQAVWKKTLEGFKKCRDQLDQANKALEQSKKNKAPQEEIASLTKAVEAARKERDLSLEHCEAVASTVLQSPEMQSFLQPRDIDDNWVTWRVLKSVFPKQWFEWCNKDSQAMAGDILAMLRSPFFLREILQEGGPNGDNYRNFLKIYKDIGAQENPVLQRLAMAVALEFANEDIMIFDTKTKIDPLQRYVHYEQAYLIGELDPAFSSFGVWELRMVVNSDASNEELSWGRHSLMNYRPDLILSPCEPKWSYCFIVKSDVAYKCPDWYKQPRTYDQMLSGGGKCGPRAWYGRFACKAFGIPTWGCRQPGHAAMTRWTPNQWETCLGAGWPVSYWTDRGGPNFKLETDVRRVCGSAARYRQLVQRLMWVGTKGGEKHQSVKNKNEPVPAEPWSALALFQSKILAATPPGKPLRDSTNIAKTRDNTEKVVSKIRRLKNQGDPEPGRPSWNKEKTKLTLPADCCCKPKQPNKIHFHKSFSGGRQIFMQGDGVLEYILTPELLWPDNKMKPKDWKLSFRVCTVHRAETDMVVTIAPEANSEPKRIYNVPLPYTKGEWQTTEAVTIVLEGGPKRLSLKRAYQQFGIALKEITLSPIYAAD
ncbi:hypothetical protein ACA910_010828 [Epithemia clementina (nom. ined.)]